MSWYVFAILGLVLLSLVVGLLCGGRIRLAATALCVNFLTSLWASLHIHDVVLLKVIGSSMDLLCIAAITFAMRTRPNAMGLHLAGGAMVLSVVVNWAAHASEIFSGDHSIGGYFVATNLAMVAAALGLLWTGLLIWGQRHGVDIGVPDPLGFDGASRVDVGAAKRWKT